MQHRDRCASQWRSDSYGCTGPDEQQQQTYVIIKSGCFFSLSLALSTLKITEPPQETRAKKSRILILQTEAKNNPCIESPRSRKIPSDIWVSACEKAAPFFLCWLPGIHMKKKKVKVILAVAGSFSSFHSRSMRVGDAKTTRWWQNSSVLGSYTETLQLEVHNQKFCIGERSKEFTECRRCVLNKHQPSLKK